MNSLQWVMMSGWKSFCKSLHM